MMSPDWFLKDPLKNIEQKVQAQVDIKNQVLKKLRATISKSVNLEQKLEAFNEQIERLKQRSIQVEKIINEKTNPLKLLEKVARSIPEDMWLVHLKITEENKITFAGFSMDYKSIGVFIEAANETHFFDKSLILSDKDEDARALVENAEDSENFEKFYIKGIVKTYDPFKGRL